MKTLKSFFFPTHSDPTYKNLQVKAIDNTQLFPYVITKMIALYVKDCEIWCIGGYDGNERLTDCEIFDPEIDCWKKVRGRMNVPRSRCVAVYHNMMTLVAAGWDGHNIHRTCEMYDLKINKWFSIPNMSRARDWSAGCVYQNGFLVMGEFQEKNGSQKTCEKLNLKTFKWESFPSLKENRWSCGACVVENIVYCLGGYQYKSMDMCTKTTKKCERFDHTKKEWLPFTSMQERTGRIWLCFVSWPNLHRRWGAER